MKKFSTSKALVITLVVALIATSIYFVPKNNKVSGAETQNGEYKEVWMDDFSGSSLDSGNWSYDIGTGPVEYDPEVKKDVTGWGNRELEYYTEDNVSVSDNCLKISAKKEKHKNTEHPELEDAKFTSGRIKTALKKSFKYGKIEAKIKVDNGNQDGVWPAFWLLGENTEESGVPWPNCGEIDVMEHANERNYFSGATHWNPNGPTGEYYHSYSSSDCKYPNENQGIDTWHIYSIEWTKDAIIWKLDGVAYKTFEFTSENRYAFTKDFFIILNLAVGSDRSPYTDSTGPKSDYKQADMYVDYVKVMQTDPEPETTTVPATWNEGIVDSDWHDVGNYAYFMDDGQGAYGSKASGDYSTDYLGLPFTLYTKGYLGWNGDYRVGTNAKNLTPGKSYTYSYTARVGKNESPEANKDVELLLLQGTQPTLIDKKKTDRDGLVTFEGDFVATSSTARLYNQFGEYLGTNQQLSIVSYSIKEGHSGTNLTCDSTWRDVATDSNTLTSAWAHKADPGCTASSNAETSLEGISYKISWNNNAWYFLKTNGLKDNKGQPVSANKDYKLNFTFSNKGSGSQGANTIMIKSGNNQIATNSSAFGPGGTWTDSVDFKAGASEIEIQVSYAGNIEIYIDQFEIIPVETPTGEEKDCVRGSWQNVGKWNYFVADRENRAAKYKGGSSLEEPFEFTEKWFDQWGWAVEDYQVRTNGLTYDDGTEIKAGDKYFYSVEVAVSQDQGDNAIKFVEFNPSNNNYTQIGNKYITTSEVIKGSTTAACASPALGMVVNWTSNATITFKNVHITKEEPTSASPTTVQPTTTVAPTTVQPTSVVPTTTHQETTTQQETTAAPTKKGWTTGVADGTWKDVDEYAYKMIDGGAGFYKEDFSGNEFTLNNRMYKEYDYSYAVGTKAMEVTAGKEYSYTLTINMMHNAYPSEGNKICLKKVDGTQVGFVQDYSENFKTDENGNLTFTGTVIPKKNVFRLYCEFGEYLANDYELSIVSYSFTDKEKTRTVSINNQVVATVEEGDTYTFPTQGKYYFENGYIDDSNNNDIYKPGGNITVNNNVSFTGIASATNTTVKGASIYMDIKKPGIRFGATAEINEGKPILSNGFTYGTLLTTYDDYAEKLSKSLTLDSLDVQGATVYNFVFDTDDKWVCLEEGSTRAGIINLSDPNLIREFVSNAYVKINYKDGTSKIIYSEGEVPIRSAKTVAVKLKASEQYKTLTPDEKAAVDKMAAAE